MRKGEDDQKQEQEQVQRKQSPKSDDGKRLDKHPKGDTENLLICRGVD